MTEEDRAFDIARTIAAIVQESEWKRLEIARGHQGKVTGYCIDRERKNAFQWRQSPEGPVLLSEKGRLWWKRTTRAPADIEARLLELFKETNWQRIEVLAYSGRIRGWCQDESGQPWRLGGYAVLPSLTRHEPA